MVELGRDKILHKVRALLAKTTEAGCTEYEEMAALAVAQEMIDDYEITDEELKLTKQQKAILKREEEVGDSYRIKWLICMAVAKFCGTSALYRKSNKQISFIGLPADVEMSMYLLHHLRYFVLRELDAYRLKVPCGAQEIKRQSNGFVLGCTMRLNTRLNELVDTHKDHTVDNRNALVVVKKAAIDEFLAANFPKLKKGGGSYTRKGTKDAYQHGKEAADKASFNRPVGHDKTKQLG
jgi:hypothetical protein